MMQAVPFWPRHCVRICSPEEVPGCDLFSCFCTSGSFPKAVPPAELAKRAHLLEQTLSSCESRPKKICSLRIIN